MINLKCSFLLFLLPAILFFLPLTAFSQNSQASSSQFPQASRSELPFILPQTIFVGDPGRLVVPLGPAFAGVAPFVLETPGIPGETRELTIRRIELERRAGVSRLFIDFIPYVPGIIVFPPLDFLASEIGIPEEALETLMGWEVQVASILVPSQMALAEPASPLAVPGTSILVYGTLSLVILLLFLGIGSSLWGRRHFRELWERFRRRHLLRVMTRFLQRLRRESFYEKKENPGFYLSLLSQELREFLSFFTGTNCRSLTAGEFMDLPLEYSVSGDYGTAGTSAGSPLPGDSQLLCPVFLCRLFWNWDTLRFSGRGVDKVDLFLALKETGDFIAALDRAEKERLLPRAKEESGTVSAAVEGRV